MLKLQNAVCSDFAGYPNKFCGLSTEKKRPENFGTPGQSAYWYNFCVGEPFMLQQVVAFSFSAKRPCCCLFLFLIAALYFFRHHPF